MKSNIFFLLLTYIFFITKQASIKGQIKVPENTVDRIKTITVTLENTDKRVHITEYGYFEFHDVEPGFYVIQVDDNLYTYEIYMVEINDDDEVKIYEYNYKNGKGIKHKHPIVIESLIKIKYGEDKQDLISSIIKSPYAIIIGITLLMFLCMKMVPQEELKAQQEEMRKQFKNYKGFGF